MEYLIAAAGILAIIAIPISFLAMIFYPMVENVAFMDDDAIRVWKALKRDIKDGKHKNGIRKCCAIETKVNIDHDGGRISTHYNPWGFGEFKHAKYRHPLLSEKQKEIIAKRAHHMLLGRMSD